MFLPLLYLQVNCMITLIKLTPIGRKFIGDYTPSVI